MRPIKLSELNMVVVTSTRIDAITATVIPSASPVDFIRITIYLKLLMVTPSALKNEIQKDIASALMIQSFVKQLEISVM